MPVERQQLLDPWMGLGKSLGHLPQVVPDTELHTRFGQDRPRDLLCALLNEVGGLAR